MGRRGLPPEFQQVMPLSKVVRMIMIATVVIWFVVNVVIEQHFLSTPLISYTLGLMPIKVLKSFFIWQPVTYLFIHTPSLFHILFNLLLLWWLGSELERYWGSRFFTLYYFASGIGAAVLYVVTITAYAYFSGQTDLLGIPVLGASAAIFGLMMAYGLVFGERIVYFMFFFPMKAKYFVAILGGIEVVLILNNGAIQGKVTSLAHLGGLVSGYIFLKVWPRIGGGQGRGRAQKKPKTGKLRLIVNNEEFNETEGPKYWN
jgi:membrane associated rhomboid family serine protease